MSKSKTQDATIEIRKLGKHSWAVLMRYSKRREMVDGFDSGAQAKAYARKAPDFIALQMGQGR